MHIQIIESPLSFDLYGVTAHVTDKSYAPTGFRLMDILWKEIKKNNLPHKGITIWAYLENDIMMTGVEMKTEIVTNEIVKHTKIHFEKYAYYKHTGSYKLISELYPMMENDLYARGIRHTLPMLEVYGHWQEDESKLETELIWNVL